MFAADSKPISAKEQATVLENPIVMILKLHWLGLVHSEV
jgi:hypothetical protein